MEVVNRYFAPGNVAVYSQQVVDHGQLIGQLNQIAATLNQHADLLDQLQRTNDFMAWIADTHPELIQQYVVTKQVESRLDAHTGL